MGWGLKVAYEGKLGIFTLYVGKEMFKAKVKISQGKCRSYTT